MQTKYTSFDNWHKICYPPCVRAIVPFPNEQGPCIVEDPSLEQLGTGAPLYQRQFIINLSKGMTQPEAARAITAPGPRGQLVTVRVLQYEMTKDESFAAAVRDTQKHAKDLKREIGSEALYRRGVYGTQKGVYHQGKRVASETEFDTPALREWMRANDPAHREGRGGRQAPTYQQVNILGNLTPEERTRVLAGAQAAALAPPVEVSDGDSG